MRPVPRCEASRREDGSSQVTRIPGTRRLRRPRPRRNSAHQQWGAHNRALRAGSCTRALGRRSNSTSDPRTGRRSRPTPGGSSGCRSPRAGRSGSSRACRVGTACAADAGFALVPRVAAPLAVADELVAADDVAAPVELRADLAADRVAAAVDVDRAALVAGAALVARNARLADVPVDPLAALALVAGSTPPS